MWFSTASAARRCIDRRCGRPRGSLVLYGLQGGNQTPFPACAAFQKNIQFFVHCIGNFTGKPELGIVQDHVALQRACVTSNQ